MPNYAIIKDGKVLNTAYFEGEDDGFDYTLIYGEGAYGVIIPDGMGVSEGYTYVDGEFFAPPAPEPTHQDLVSEAESQKQSLIYGANIIFVNWQTKLLLNRATEDERDALNKWLDYFDSLQSIDSNDAPDIDWPQQPEIPADGQ